MASAAGKDVVLRLILASPDAPDFGFAIIALV
jgi:hypothetical protein